MPNPQTYPSYASLKVLTDFLAKTAQVPANNRQECCDRLISAVLRIRDRDRRSTGAQAGGGLIEAADAARTLGQKFTSLNKLDREWVERIKATQLGQFAAGEIDDLETTIINISTLLQDALGRASSAPGRPPNVKDQMLRELIFDLLFATSRTGGKFTFNKNSASGTLAIALDRLRNYLQKGLVPNPIPAVTIQRLKTDFQRLNR